MRTIPKIVHYCWFGNNEKPQDVKKCIETWKKHMPDYEFMEWNESNFDMEQAIPYVKQAYEAKKYAFVSDFVRIQALYRFGGVYFDTDIEVLKSFEEYLDDRDVVLGFESERSLITAFIAVSKEHPYIKEFMESYYERSFLKEDGTYDLTTINERFSALMETHGVDLKRNEYQEFGPGCAVYPIEIFCGFDVTNWHENITGKTCTVHHMAASWLPGAKGVKLRIIKMIQKIIGYERYDRLKQRLKG